jgi:hypothetical protein
MGEGRSGPPSSWKVLHRIQCVNESEPRIYTDEPFRAKYSGSQWHLRGRDLVKNIDVYIERHKELAFIIYHDYTCEGHERQARSRDEENEQARRKYNFRKDGVDQENPHNSLNSRRRILNDENVEIKPKAASLHIICDILHEGMLHLLQQDPGFKSSFDYNEDDEEIPVPFLAYYHFRTAIQAALDELDDEDEQAQLQLLSNYINSAYCDEFSQADSMLAKGVITQPFLKYLFVPNEVFIAIKDEQTTGYLQQGFLDLKSSSPLGHVDRESEVLTLKGQNWVFDGEFTMQFEKLDVTWSTLPQKEQKINKLNIYPLRYASEEVKQSLAARGKTFWACRKHKYVEYQQEIPKNMQNSVSRSIYCVILKRIY